MGWVRFVIVRSVVFALAGIGALAVLCLAIYQATNFLHNQYDRPYLIFAIVNGTITIILVGVLASKYSFYTHIGCIGLLAVLWLALASYTTDRIGYVQCEALDGQTRPTDHGNYNAVAWCRELKAMMAFSWYTWALFMIAIVSWLRLSEHEENTYGERSEGSRHEERAMEEGQYENEQYYGGQEGLAEMGAVNNGGYVNNGGTFPAGGSLGARYISTGGAYANGGFAGAPVNSGGGGQVVYQQPGHNVVIQNGQVTQVPVNMGTGLGVPMTTGVRMATGVPMTTGMQMGNGLPMQVPMATGRMF